MDGHLLNVYGRGRSGSHRGIGLAQQSKRFDVGLRRIYERLALVRMPRINRVGHCDDVVNDSGVKNPHPIFGDVRKMVGPRFSPTARIAGIDPEILGIVFVDY